MLLLGLIVWVIIIIAVFLTIVGLGLVWTGCLMLFGNTVIGAIVATLVVILLLFPIAKIALAAKSFLESW